MSLLRKLGLAVLLVAVSPWSFSQAGVYVGIGGPGPYYYRRPYYRPWYGYGGYGYGGVYVAPPPVVVGGAAPVVVQQPAVVQQPVVVQPAYSPSSPPPQAPAPLPMPSPTPPVANASGSGNVTPAVAVGNAEAEIDAALQQLRGGDEQARADAAVRLGRLRAERAVGPIVKVLNSDSSPVVREAAARGLGLIGSPSALSALQYAAQADNDREVRHSAGFAAETIRGSMGR
ncbi:MAG TPA: HEAT repeat domain-containing protein [Gemmataceae bacterium]|nr:HEAT repeat domain-containing protein [Gemmataceae bacterium]